MSPNISKPSATLVPLFSKIISSLTTYFPCSSLFIPPPRLFNSSSFGIAKVLPFPFPTKCFHNFFLPPHFNTLIPTKKFFTQFPASITVSDGFYHFLNRFFLAFRWKFKFFRGSCSYLWYNYSMNWYLINDKIARFAFVRRASIHYTNYKLICMIWLLELSCLIQGQQIVLLLPVIYLFLSFMIPLSSSVLIIPHMVLLYIWQTVIVCLLVSYFTTYW